jgi:hypothetical protein
MSIVRFASLAVVSLSVAAVTSSLPTEASAEGYYPRTYRSYGYRVPYRNDYHGYWRDQGYGFSGHRYQSYGPYWNGSQGYWRDQGYGFSRPGYGGFYRYGGYGSYGPVYPNVRSHPRSRYGLYR